MDYESSSGFSLISDLGGSIIMGLIMAFII